MIRPPGPPPQRRAGSSSCGADTTRESIDRNYFWDCASRVYTPSGVRPSPALRFGPSGTGPRATA